MKFLINSERTVAMTIYDFQQRILGKEVSLADFKGKVLIIANTASKCGFTPIQGSAKAIWRSIGRRVRNFRLSCNQFDEQEPCSNAEVKTL